MVVFAPAAKDVAQAGSGVDCQATNFQPWGVFVQALRNSSLRLRGWVGYLYHGLSVRRQLPWALGKPDIFQTWTISCSKR